MNGKGSQRRPSSVPPQTFAERWNATFGNPKAKVVWALGQHTMEEMRAAANADAPNSTTQPEGSPDA